MTNRESVISEEFRIYGIDGFNGEAHPGLKTKLVPSEQLEMTGNYLRSRSLQIAFTTGTYDMIHIGHGRYLELARSLGDILVVALNSDKSVKTYKGPDRPILGEEKRAEMLAYLEAVNLITLYDESTAEGVIRLLKPDCYLCVEGSWPEGTNLKDKPEVAAMIEHGGRIYCSPRQEPHLSTSAIVERLEAAGKFQALAALRTVLDTEAGKLTANRSL